MWHKKTGTFKKPNKNWTNPRKKIIDDVAGLRPATSSVHYTTNCNTQSSAPEDGQNNFPKHVELTGIINKPLLLHLVGCLYYLYQWCTVKQISDNEIYLLIKYIKSVHWRVAKFLSYIEEARCLKVNRVHIQYVIKRGTLWVTTLHCSVNSLTTKWHHTGRTRREFPVKRCLYAQDFINNCAL